MPRLQHLLCGVAAAFVLTTATAPSDAADSFVNRGLTQPRLVFAGDVGLGIARSRFDRGPFRNDVGAGMNVEGALGVTDTLELGFRTGVRFGDSGRITQADAYGRTLWTETWGTGVDTVANPELRIRWIAYSGSVAEVGLDGRVFMPIETGTDFGMMFGVPLAFHVVDFLRVDTGVYTPVVFNDPARVTFTIPAYVWFQPTPKLWLGPMASIRFVDYGPPGRHNGELLLGFGMGYQVASAVDLKWMILSPRIDENIVRPFGAGFGVQFRIGE